MAGPINEHASALAQEWKRLTRAATFVALLTAPAFFLVLFDSEHFSLLAALIVAAVAADLRGRRAGAAGPVPGAVLILGRQLVVL